MDRIKLTRTEKAVLRMVDSGQGACPATYPRHAFNLAVASLERKGLLRGAYKEGGDVVDSRISSLGRQYLSENPNLRNPLDWGKVGTAAAIVSAVIGLVALFIACNAT